MVSGERWLWGGWWGRRGVGDGVIYAGLGLKFIGTRGCLR